MVCSERDCPTNLPSIHEHAFPAYQTLSTKATGLQPHITDPSGKASGWDHLSVTEKQFCRPFLSRSLTWLNYTCQLTPSCPLSNACHANCWNHWGRHSVTSLFYLRTVYSGSLERSTQDVLVPTRTRIQFCFVPLLWSHFSLRKQGVLFFWLSSESDYTILSTW